jgi:Na+/melibiose symporter-like transporter
LGRRLPFILVGLPISILFLLLVRFAGHLGQPLALPLVAVSIILFSIFWNVVSDPYQALLVDITPEKERPTFNALLSLASLAGNGALMIFATLMTIEKGNVPDVVFDACAVLMFLSFVPVFFVREPKEAAEAAHRETRIPLRRYLNEMRTFKEAFKLLISIFFLWSALNAIMPFLTTFPKKVLHVSTGEAFIVYMVMGVSVGVFCYPWGWLATHYGNRRPIVAGTILLILTAALGLVVPSYIWLFPLAILAGAGFSATTVLTYPYLSQLVPGSRIGVFTGLQTAFSAIAVPVSVLFTGILITGFGYRAIFAVLAIMMVFDLLCLLWIDDAAGKEQVRRLEECSVREDDYETHLGSTRR